MGWTATMEFWNDLTASILDPEDVKILEWTIGAIALDKADSDRVIVLSGPPRSGKTTLIKIILQTLGADCPIPIFRDSPMKQNFDKFSIVETNLPNSRFDIPKDNRFLVLETHGHENDRKLLEPDYQMHMDWFEYNHWYILNHCLQVYMDLGDDYIS